VRNELTTMTYPDSSTSTRSYHATGALNQLGLDGSTISTRSYDAGSRLTSEVLGNGITESRTYRNDNLLSTISYSNSNIGDLSYTWDANKNKTSEVITGVMSGYGFTSAGTSYDFEDRLVGYSRAATSGPAQLAQSWNLTSVGDWNSTTINGTVQNRTHGPTHELLTAGGQNVTHDVKGNMTSIPANLREAGASTAMNLSWDFDNKMKSADIDANGTADVSFQYDALGRRVARVGSSGSWVFVQSGQQTIADYVVGNAPSASLYRYVYASYIDEPVVRKGNGTSGPIYYYHRNQLYSIYSVTNSVGAVMERYAYAAYGQPTVLDSSANAISASAISNRYCYTGREWDATTGLFYFRARWMSGLIGRFLNRDPNPHTIDSPFWDEFSPFGLVLHSPAIYEFAASTPTTFIDLLGFCPFRPIWEGRRRIRCREIYPQNRATRGLWYSEECRTKIPNPRWDVNARNGCTFVGPSPFYFTSACDNHDLCWNKCGANQDACDLQFLQDMLNICNTTYPSRGFAWRRCIRLADTYFSFVHRNVSYFDTTQDSACLWVSCRFNCRLAPPSKQPIDFDGRPIYPTPGEIDQAL
jgi:RHS repeat-associated protein